MLKKIIQKGTVVLIIFVFSLLLFSHYLRISPTSSAGYHIFIVKPCRFVRGEYVSVKISPDDPFVPDPVHTRLIKQIACLPREKIEKRGLNYYCNGKYIATAKLRSRDGRPLKPWIPPTHPIPPDYYFLANHNINSYDSRYLGLFHKNRIVECLYPLF